MVTISAEKARGGISSPSHAVLKVLLISMGTTIVAGFAIIALL